MSKPKSYHKSYIELVKEYQRKVWRDIRRQITKKPRHDEREMWSMPTFKKGKK